MRGALTEEIKAISKELMGYEITTEELRLMPYLFGVMMNMRKIDLSKVNNAELDILDMWEEKGFISGMDDNVLVVTKSFWGAMSEIMWLSYVNSKKQLKGKKNEKIRD